MRKNPLINEQYYHVLNRSIAKYQIFNNTEDYSRIIELIDLYRFAEFPCKYSKFLSFCPTHRRAIIDNLTKKSDQLVDIIAYCIMPTHIHLILKQLKDNGITKYMSKILDSYSRYFNIHHDRKGPLWESHFNSILVGSDEQMLHLTRYIHLNAVSAGLVKKPQQWHFSSYNEYLGKTRHRLCRFDEIMDIDPEKYRKFVLDRISYQKELSRIKHLLLENYAG